MKNTKIKYHYFIFIIMIILLGNLKAIFFHAGGQEQEIYPWDFLLAGMFWHTSRYDISYKKSLSSHIVHKASS